MSPLPRALLRSACHALARCPPVSGIRVVVPRATTAAASGMKRSTTTRGMATVGNLPPMEPHKERAREMAVGELEGAEITIEPLRRVGEDDKTMRARLVYQSRKRGILETDLVLSTFADEYLPTMTRERMAEYDLFLDENDWDIYYWATQEKPSSTTTTNTTTDVSASEASTGGVPLTGDHGDSKASQNVPETEEYATGKVNNIPATGTGEWAQTVGTFKPAYRPVPSRWRNSETLRALREHVRKRSGAAGGMAFMPKLRT